MLNKSRVWLLQLVSFLVGLRTYQHPSYKNEGIAAPETGEGLFELSLEN